MVTAGFILAVTENFAPARRTAAMTSWPQNALSIRAITKAPAFGSAPAVAAVLRVSVTRRAAPRAEFVDPFRKRAAAITGAAAGVDTTPSRAFKPFTPE